MHDVLCAAMCVPAPSQMAKVKPVALGGLYDLIRSSRGVVVQSLQNAIFQSNLLGCESAITSPLAEKTKSQITNVAAGQVFLRVTMSRCECGEICKLNPGSPPDKKLGRGLPQTGCMATNRSLNNRKRDC